MPAARILIVEDEAVVARDLRQTLTRLGYEVSDTATTGAQALASAAARRPELALMDVHIKGEVDGIDTALELAKRHQVPVVFLTAYADDETIRRASAAEALGYVVKPFDEVDLKTTIYVALEKARADVERRRYEEELRRTNHELQLSRALLQELSIRDELTGLFNRREFNRLLKEECARALRYGHPLSVLLIDLDLFKSINDVHGHDAGDSILAGVAGRVSGCLRSADRASRYGGEELAVLLPETSSAGALTAGERIRQAIASTPFEALNLEGTRVSLTATVSIGVGTIPDHGSEERGIVRAADTALYVAKRSGRNRVVLGTRTTPPRSNEESAS